MRVGGINRASPHNVRRPLLAARERHALTW
jgi:hypothetical protein